jgi:hypothetical protein
MRSIIKLSIIAGLILPVLASAQTQTLPMGWSIVGNNTGAAINANAVFGNATAPTAVTSNVTTVWTWNNALNQWNFFAPSMTPQELSMYAASKGYGVLSSVSKDEGFWVNAKAQFLYSPTSTASVDVKPLQGSNSSTYTKSSASGTGCAALGLQTASSTSGYVSVSVVTSGSRATVNMWDSSSYFVFTFDYQSGNNTTGYNLTGTFKENITGWSGSSTALSFRQTSWGSYVGFLTATTNNCTLSAAIS